MYIHINCDKKTELSVMQFGQHGLIVDYVQTYKHFSQMQVFLMIFFHAHNQQFDIILRRYQNAHSFKHSTNIFQFPPVSFL